MNRMLGDILFERKKLSFSPYTSIHVCYLSILAIFGWLGFAQYDGEMSLSRESIGSEKDTYLLTVLLLIILGVAILSLFDKEDLPKDVRKTRSFFVSGKPHVPVVADHSRIKLVRKVSALF